MRIFVLEAGEPHLGDVVAGDRLALGLVRAAQFESEGHVAHHGRPRHQRKILEHESAFGAGCADLLAVDRDGAAVGLVSAPL